MAEETGNRTKPKRKRVIKAKSGNYGDRVYWSKVNPHDLLKLVSIAVDCGLAATPSARKDHTALCVRFWHPEIDAEAYYFVPDNTGLFDEDFWSYLAQIVAAITDRATEDVLEDIIGM